MAPSAGAGPRPLQSPVPSEPARPIRSTTLPPTARDKAEGSDRASSNDAIEPHWLPAIESATD
jgi:hypothetical protein